VSYELTALIGVGSVPTGAVALPQGAWLLPLCDDGPHGAEDLSRDGAVVYVAAEFFGGVGDQAATLYRHGRVEREFANGYHAINEAVVALGITAESPRDAFDTLGLGRYRHTEDWLRSIGPRPSL